MRHWILAGALALGSLSACELDERDLATFVHSAAGPEKLRALLRDDSRSAELRAQAALELLEVERPELSGTRAVLHDFAQLPGAQRGAIAARLTPRLMARLGQAPVGQALEPAVVKLKDACVDLLALLPDQSRRQLGDSLLGFILDDAERRADAGRFTLEQVARAAGANAASALLSGLSTQAGSAFLTRLSTLIDALADAATRPRIAARLLEIERAFPPPAKQPQALVAVAFTRGAGAAGEAQSGRAQAELALLREQHLLPALGRFVDQAPIRARLVAIAADSASPTSERALALEMLAGRATSAELPSLLTVTLDENEAEPLRVLALTRAIELRSPDLVPQLLPLVGDRSHARLRQLASFFVLEIGGGAPSLLAFLRAMPKHWQMAYSRSEIDAYSERLARFSPEGPLFMLLGEKLHSVFWWQRVLALRYFAARGTFEDIWRIRQHLDDALYTYGEGWPKGYTVGQEAAACLVQIEKRFAIR